MRLRTLLKKKKLELEKVQRLNLPTFFSITSLELFLLTAIPQCTSCTTSPVPIHCEGYPCFLIGVEENAVEKEDAGVEV